MTSTAPDTPQWWGIVSPALNLEASGYLTTPHHAGRVLGGPEKMGGLTLIPADRQLVEYIRTLQLGWMQSVSWPILVEGRWADDNWVASEREASRELHKLCCLLSLLWIEAWQVRVGPQRSDAMKPRVLDDSSAPKDWHVGDVPQRGMRDEVELPIWIHTTWWESYYEEVDDPMRDDPRTSRAGAALSLWREGKLLQPEHPSFALVAFTGSLEQVGRVLIERGTLAKHLDKPNRRFWAAVDFVANAADATTLRKAKVYDLRSAAAHGERMHGLETLYGPVLVPPFLSRGGVDRVSEFVHQTVRIMADVARSALLRVFSEAP